jgi:hypothetical protein
MFHTSFDREFDGEQEYVFSEFFRGSLVFEKSKNLEGCEKVNFSPILYKVEFFKFHANLDHSNCHILVQPQKLNQKLT